MVAALQPGDGDRLAFCERYIVNRSHDCFIVSYFQVFSHAGGSHCKLSHLLRGYNLRLHHYCRCRGLPASRSAAIRRNISPGLFGLLLPRYILYHHLIKILPINSDYNLAIIIFGLRFLDQYIIQHIALYYLCHQDAGQGLCTPLIIQPSL